MSELLRPDHFGRTSTGDTVVDGVLVDDQDSYNHQSREAVEKHFPLDFRGGGTDVPVDTSVTVRRMSEAERLHRQERARRRSDRRDAATRRDFRQGAVA
jgi:hypothetical protein